ncbi:Transcriptional activator HlyU [Methylobrevis pamukkalensis]|uniref:Transcriptional activator HlyU n=1 Tax=Methylobrevis pamukkalensis TaxID=1439726 RepID=A0A1E3GYH3_9HYPH|nr:HlyU family transcriptional regulator [Methylobrevis pamukkalensis]ODN68975.1 Transcriptional activator HlyU [Methylobrevis pamukkalensis]
MVEKTFGDETKSHRFVRAEKHATEAAATEFALTKGRQIVEQLGDHVFD